MAFPPSSSQVVSLIQGGGAGDDKLLRHALSKIGEYYRERRQWDKAVHYFAQGKQQAALADCLYHLGDFEVREAR